jgi:hypothetical protein
MLRIVGVSGDSYLIYIGRGIFNEMEMLLGRVYDRRRHVLHPPLPVYSITARGYWEPPDDLSP